MEPLGMMAAGDGNKLPPAPADDSASIELVHQRLWYGKVPVVFSLHPSEVTTLHAPRPYYVMIPRMSYLVTQTRSVIEYFRDAAPPIAAGQGNTIWFEAHGTPLKWHLPFGLLWDLHNATEESLLPWQITVHFQGFPSDELLPCENEQSVEVHFMHSLKQATFLRTGSTKAIMSMPEAQQSQIWHSVVQNNYQSYCAATRELQLRHIDHTRSPNSSSSFMRLIPIRVHVDREPAIQMPITPLLNDKEKTLQDVLYYLLPDLFPSQEPAAANTTKALIVHGISVPSTVSIVALYQHFAYADGFLYVSVVTRQ